MVLGVLPDVEPALCLAAVVFLLLLDASMLLMGVTRVGRPSPLDAPSAATSREADAKASAR